MVVNNGSYGTIRMHQEACYPGRPIATALDNPDFVALGRVDGLGARRVAATADFGAALEAARAFRARAHRIGDIDDPRPAPQRDDWLTRGRNGGGSCRGALWRVMSWRIMSLCLMDMSHSGNSCVAVQQQL
jgi:hypothetical protein